MAGACSPGCARRSEPERLEPQPGREFCSCSGPAHRTACRRCATYVLLQGLAARLSCVHVAIYAPALFVDASSAPRGNVAKLPTGLISELLWPWIRESGEPRHVKSVRPRDAEPMA